MPLGDVLLGVLSGGPAHGYDLKAAHDARFPAAKGLAYGQVYSTLSRLQQAGLVEVVETRQGAGPERTVYALTESGVDALNRWLHQTEDPGPQVAGELIRKTVTALHTHHDADGFLRRQREVHLTEMRRLSKDLAASTSVDEQIGIDLALAHLDAELRWLDTARERVRDARRRHTSQPAPPLGPVAGPTRSTGSRDEP